MSTGNKECVGLKLASCGTHTITSIELTCGVNDYASPDMQTQKAD